MTLPLLPKVDPDHLDSKNAKEKEGDGKDQRWNRPPNENGLP
jgi:hypothetical protein